MDNKIVFSEVCPDDFHTIRIIKYRYRNNERYRFRYMLIVILYGVGMVFLQIYKMNLIK